MERPPTSVVRETLPDDGEDAPQVGLRAIAVMEGLKGVLALLGAGGLEVIGPATLQHWIAAVLAHFQSGREPGLPDWLQHAINPESVHIAAAVVAAYGLMRLIEAWGLWRARAWASWFGCISAAVYIPFELYALFHHPGWLKLVVLVVNLIVVWVLARDLLRRRALKL